MPQFFVDKGYLEARICNKQPRSFSQVPIQLQVGWIYLEEERESLFETLFLTSSSLCISDSSIYLCFLISRRLLSTAALYQSGYTYHTRIKWQRTCENVLQTKGTVSLPQEPWVCKPTPCPVILSWEGGGCVESPRTPRPYQPQFQPASKSHQAHTVYIGDDHTQDHYFKFRRSSCST